MIAPGLAAASGDKRLRGTSHRVLEHLHRELDYWHFRSVKVLAVARATAMDKGTADRAVDQLVLFGYIIEGARDDRLRTYRLCTPQKGCDTATKLAA